MPRTCKKVSILLSTFYCPYSKFFWEACAQEKENQNGVPFQVEAPPPSRKGYEWLHVLVDLDLNPIIIFFEVLITLQFWLKTVIKFQSHLDQNTIHVRSE